MTTVEDNPKQKVMFQQRIIMKEYRMFLQPWQWELHNKSCRQ